MPWGTATAPQFCTWTMTLGCRAHWSLPNSPKGPEGTGLGAAGRTQGGSVLRGSLWPSGVSEPSPSTPQSQGTQRPHLLPMGLWPSTGSIPRCSLLGNQGCSGGGTWPCHPHSSPSSLRLTLRGLARDKPGGTEGDPPSRSAWLEPRERRSWLCFRRKSTGAGQP